MINILFDDNLLDDDDIIDGDSDDWLDVEDLGAEAAASEDLYDETQVSQVHGAHEPSFMGLKYTDAEISRMRDDISCAEYEMKCREHDVSEWVTKVSFNNTKEKIARGDYEDVVKCLNEAKTRYNNARSTYNSAKSKLNNVLK